MIFILVLKPMQMTKSVTIYLVSQQTLGQVWSR